jgi:uncharacterized protein
MPVTNPIAAVTGASSGIGAVYAERLAARGYDLILVARRADRLEALAGRLEAAHGVRVRPLAADLTKPGDLEAVEAVLRAESGLTLLVNNAGNGKIADFDALPVADALDTIALNVTALVRLTHAVLPGFRARNAGTVVNIASVLAVRALAKSAVYSGTKGFVLNFSEALQQELKGTGIRVQAVLPAATGTEFFDHAGVPLSAYDPAIVMTAENLVDTALAGLDRGEAVTLPSLHDEGLWKTVDGAHAALFGAAMTGVPAPRYRA